MLIDTQKLRAKIINYTEDQKKKICNMGLDEETKKASLANLNVDRNIAIEKILDTEGFAIKYEAYEKL